MSPPLHHGWPELRDRVDSWLALGLADDQLSPAHRRRVQVITAVTATIVLVAIPFVFQYAWLGVPRMSVAVLITIAIGIGNVAWMHRSHDVVLAGYVGVGALMCLLLASNVVSGGFYDPNFAWLYVIPMLAALLVDARAGWVFTAVVLVTTVAFWLVHQQAPLPSWIPEEAHAGQSLANRVSAIAAIAIVLGALASREAFSSRLLRRANQDLRDEMAQRLEMQTRLVQTERMASMGELAAGMAHEVNNPLTYLIGNLHMVQEILPELPAAKREEIAPMLEDALDGADRVRLIVRDLKTFTRPNDEITRVDVASAFERASKLVSAELKHRAHLVTEFSGVAQIYANEARIVQVAINLLTNASQAIEEGHRDGNEVRVRVQNQGDMVIVEVSDTGRGMDPTVQRRAFEPLFTTKQPGIGTGLGLSICRSILSSVGGTIQLHSTPGLGTTVCLRIPAAPAPGHTPQAPPLVPVPHRTLKILAVDDEEQILSWLGRELAEHDVTTETDGARAVSLFCTGRFDVMLCDLMMPNLTGQGIHIALQERAPDLAGRIVFMTGGTFTPTGEAFARSDGLKVLQKPMEAQALRRALAEVAAPW
ncbi:MAG: response regulator [Myxococcales bacterium]|nr:response regulator [Myxococcales bacterium]